MSMSLRVYDNSPYFQQRSDVICIGVVACVLYKLEQEVRFFVVLVARKSLKSALEFAAEPTDSGERRRVGVVVAVLLTNDGDESRGGVTLGRIRHAGNELGMSNIPGATTTTTVTFYTRATETWTSLDSYTANAIKLRHP